MFILFIAFIFYYLAKFTDWLSSKETKRIIERSTENGLNDYINNIRQALEGSDIELLENVPSGEFNYVNGKKIEVAYLWALKGPGGYFKGFYDLREIDSELYQLDKSGKIARDKKAPENPKTEPEIFFEDIQE
ncbi:MAG: hypothetical protein AB1782_01220 [Cyanobacteriota bacterium]